MHERIISGLLLFVAAIHLLPVIGVLGGDRLATLYDIQVKEQNLELLLRHRAILFGLLGVFLGYAAFTPALQPLAFIAALVSVVSFLVLATSVDSINAAISRVVTADIVATIALILAIGLYGTVHFGRP